MTRTMADATHVSVGALPSGLQLVAGYVTGDSSIQWTAADWARFPGIPHVTIDQGFTGSPVMTAIVRDVESGAWTMAAAVNRTGWVTPRPTLYFSESMLARRLMTTKERHARIGRRLRGAFSAGWRGDVWVALYDDVPSLNFPVPAGINVVAKQYTDLGGGGAYDISVVFDPTWPAPATDPPQENDMAFMVEAGSGNVYLVDGGRSHQVQGWDQVDIYKTAGIPLAAGMINAAEEAALLKDFPPGQPVVTVPPITPTPFPAVLKVSGTITPS